MPHGKTRIFTESIVKSYLFSIKFESNESFKDLYVDFVFYTHRHCQVQILYIYYLHFEHSHCNTTKSKNYIAYSLSVFVDHSDFISGNVICQNVASY